MQGLFLRLVQVAGLVDGLLHRLWILRQLRIEPGTTQRLFHRILLVRELIQLICDVLQLILDRGGLLGIEFSSLETVGKSFERFVGRLKITFGQTLRKSLRVLITLAGDLKVRQRIPQCSVHFGFVAIEDLIKSILKSRNLPDRLATNLLRRLLDVPILLDLLVLQHLIDGAFHFRGEHRVFFDHRHEILDFFVRLLIGLRQHHPTIRRRGRKQVALRDQGPDADRDKQEYWRYPPTNRGLRAEGGPNGTSNTGASRHLRRIGDCSDREWIISSNDLNRGAESIPKTKSLVDRDRDRDCIAA